MNPNDYLLAIHFLPSALGFIYFFLFWAFLFQIKGLIGENGIQPLKRFLEYFHIRLGKKRFYYLPTLFWINASDTALMTLVSIGTVLSLLLIFNVFPLIILPILFLLHLSLLTAGQDFMSFGWETFFLEISFNTFFLLLSFPPNPLIWISINLLLFRFYFQAGVSKLLSKDQNWRNLTALAYHYQSQPIPNTLAWYVHKLPIWFHKLSTAAMFFIELVIPFAIFLTQEARLAAFVLFAFLQWTIWITGNFSYLNYLSVAFSIILVSDSYFPFSFPIEHNSTPLWLDLFVWGIGAGLIFLQLMSLWNYFFYSNQLCSRLLTWLRPFCIVNRYGIFAVMTTKRYEIVVEGSQDGAVWKEYLFKHKPSELTRRPRRISPYQPRLDWQAWFLPFSEFEAEPWFRNFLGRLLQGSPEVLKLLRENPFPDAPPTYIRAVVYDYEFSDWETKKKFGFWWKRHFIGFYSPVMRKKI